VTGDSAFKKQIRARMAETGENYTAARRAVIAGRDPGQPPVAARASEVAEEIAVAIRRRIPPASIRSIAVGGDLDHIRVEIRVIRPGMTLGPGGEVFGRIRDDLEELTRKPVRLNVLADLDPLRRTWWDEAAGRTWA
jgi:hypothetical protein